MDQWPVESYRKIAEKNVFRVINKTSMTYDFSHISRRSWFILLLKIYLNSHSFNKYKVKSIVDEIETLKPSDVDFVKNSSFVILPSITNCSQLSSHFKVSFNI